MEGVTSLGQLHMSRLYKGQRIEVILNKNNLISGVFFIDFRSCRLLENWGVFFSVCACALGLSHHVSQRMRGEHFASLHMRTTWGAVLGVCAWAVDPWVM